MRIRSGSGVLSFLVDTGSNLTQSLAFCTRILVLKVVLVGGAVSSPLLRRSDVNLPRVMGAILKCARMRGDALERKEFRVIPVSRRAV